MQTPTDDCASADAAVVFITDAAFLFPTLTAASLVAERLAARATAGRRPIELIVYRLGGPAGEAREERLAGWASASGVRLERFEDEAWRHVDRARLPASHVPSASLARLSLDAVLPRRYRQILYLDGDVLPVGDLTPLLDYQVPPGRFAAASDAAYLFEGERNGPWRVWGPQVRRLGLARPEQYFNAGVMVLSREVLAEGFVRAGTFLERHPERCMYLDQCALNATLAAERLPLSPLYNAGPDLVACGALRTRCPALVHFCGPVKPWLHDAVPWGDRFEPRYRRAELELPVARPAVSQATRDAVRRRQRERALRLALLPPWHRIAHRRRFERHLRHTDFAAG